MFIPKGTMVIGNIWAIHMDPRNYPNPMAFDPERYLEEDGNIPWDSGRENRERS
jgi:cytochrome P450